VSAQQAYKLRESDKDKASRLGVRRKTVMNKQLAQHRG
jgi:hypothetical protein